jgi:predicted ATPase
MIERVWVKNYRSLADVEVNLEPLTVLVGHNGAGKSNLVDVLRFIRDALQLGLDTALIKRGGLSSLYCWGVVDNVEIGVQIKTGDIQGIYTFTLGLNQRGDYIVKQESCRIKWSDNEEEAIFSMDQGRWVHHPQNLDLPIQTSTLNLPLIADIVPFNHLYVFLTAMGFYNIFPNSLTEPQKPANPFPLDEHGTNMASALRRMLTSRSMPDLRKAIQTIIPGAGIFHVREVSGYLVPMLIHAQLDDAIGFDFSQESDGTLRMLGILVALYQYPPRTLITLEEPELNIHPGALRLLWDEIEHASSRSQIILTTHSPDLLDMCQADHLRVVEKIDGVTHIGPIEQTQKQAIQERLFAPGELLQAEGLRRAIQGQLA